MTMTDLIRRADAIEAVHNWYDQPYKDIKDYIRGVDKIALDIEALPSAEPSLKAIKRQIDEHWYLDPPSAEAVQVWIPCSERLPEKGEVVLITNGKGNVRCGQYRSEYDVRGGTHYWWWKGKTVESVLAWQPLPTPYKGGDDE